MSSHEDRSTRDGPALTPEERAFVARLAETYAPKRPSALQQASFDRHLRGRLERRTPPAWPGPLPIAAAVAAILAVGLLLWRAAPGSVPNTLDLERAREDLESRVELATEETAPSTAEDTLLALGADTVADTDDVLPDDYIAIESLFLGGS